MSNILQYAPWCKIYIITERPWEGEKKVVNTTAAMYKGMKDLMKKYGAGQHTVSQEELDAAFDAGGERKVYNVSPDIISGQVRLGINQAHAMGFTLANLDGKYTNLFMSMDRVILFLKRVKVVQAFSGFLDSVPVKTMRTSQPVSFTATCTMKRLTHTYWNPYLYFGKGWADPEVTPEEYLHYLVEEVGGWEKEDVYIQPFHDIEFWNQLAEYSIHAPAASITIDTNATGTGAGGGPTPGGTELTTGDACLPNKLDNFLAARKSPMAGQGNVLVAMGKKYKVNPALVVAIAGKESIYGTYCGASVGGPRGVNETHPYNYWGRKSSSGGWMSFSSLEVAIENQTSYMTKYLDPKGEYYRGGTIRDIGKIYCEDAEKPGGWVDSVTDFYNNIMQQCANPNSGIGQTSPSRNHDTSRLDQNNPNYQPPSDPQTPQEEQAALRERGGGVGSASASQNVYCGFPLAKTATYNGGPYEYINSWGYPRSNGRTHKGCDIMADGGQPAFAVVSGNVQFLSGGNAGNYIKLTSDDGSGTYFYYMHMQSFGFPGLSDGSHVNAGQQIGYVGNTGNAIHTDPHIHFQYHPNGGESSSEVYNWLSGHDPAKGAPGYTGAGSASGGGLNDYYLQLTGYMSLPPGGLETIEGVFQLAVQERLLKHIFEAAKFGMYVCNTDGTGRFIARWADYFGEEPDAKGNSGPHFSVEDIEIINGSVQVNDQNMVTHQFVIGDSTQDGSIDWRDWWTANYYDESGIPQGDGFGIAVTAFNSERLGILNESEWTAEEFIKRFGYRPSVEQELLISNVAQAQYYSEYLFRTKWANCVTGSLQTTFLPEVRPMMVIKIPSWRMQFYVQSVTHTFGTKFGSSFSLIAGAFLDDSLGSRNPMLAKINSSPIGDNYNLAIGEADAISPGSGTAKIFGPESGKSPFSWFNPISGHSPY
jgi:murein DD-endopeptidase MepM/ murein hydrolase activator NlpD